MKVRIAAETESGVPPVGGCPAPTGFKPGPLQNCHVNPNVAIRRTESLGSFGIATFVLLTWPLIAQIFGSFVCFLSFLSLRVLPLISRCFVCFLPVPLCYVRFPLSLCLTCLHPSFCSSAPSWRAGPSSNAQEHSNLPWIQDTC